MSRPAMTGHWKFGDAKTGVFISPGDVDDMRAGLAELLAFAPSHATEGVDHLLYLLGSATEGSGLPSPEMQTCKPFDECRDPPPTRFSPGTRAKVIGPTPPSPFPRIATTADTEP